MKLQTFVPSSTLTFATVEADRKRFVKLAQKSAADGIFFDLSHVEHCDSAGLALLIEATRLCRHYKIQLEIIHMPEVITAWAAFCGVEKMLGQQFINPISLRKVTNVEKVYDKVC